MTVNAFIVTIACGCNTSRTYLAAKNVRGLFKCRFLSVSR